MRRILTILITAVFLFGTLAFVDINHESFTFNSCAAMIYVGAGVGNDSSTIQGAIDSADPGDTIFVYSGEYKENADAFNAVIIDKSITLIGENRDTTIIDAQGKLYGVHLDGADQVNLSGFHIMSANSFNVKFTGSNFSRVYANNITSAGFCAVGIFPGSYNAVEYNVISNNSQGILISGGSTLNIVQGNTISSTGDRAVTIEGGAHENTVSSNTISVFNVGVQIYESRGNDISGNTITDGGEGVKIFDGSSALLQGNIFSGNNIGLSILDHSSALAFNCSFEDTNTMEISLGDSVWPNGDLILINSSFDIDAVEVLDDASLFTVQYFLHLRVLDESAEPLSGISVRVMDNPSGTFDETYFTDSGGYMSWLNLTAYTKDMSGIVHHDPYNLTSANDTAVGYASPEVVLSSSKEITITVRNDVDGDGIFDSDDDFPEDPTQWEDSDGDGYGDNSSGNSPDAFPSDPTQWQDSDGDGYGDNPAGSSPDAFPTDPTQQQDTDGDGYGDNASGSNPDAFPDEATQWEDSDGDGYGDNPEGNDPDHFPNDETEWKDSDSDGYGDAEDDAFPDDPDEWKDTDGDGVGDNGDFLPELDNTLFLIIVVMIVVIIVIILALWFIRDKKKRKPVKWDEQKED